MPPARTHAAVLIAGLWGSWALGWEHRPLGLSLEPGTVSGQVSQQHGSVLLGTFGRKADDPNLNPVSGRFTTHHGTPRVSLEQGNGFQDRHQPTTALPVVQAEGGHLPLGLLPIRPDRAPAPRAGHPHTASRAGPGWPAAAGAIGCTDSCMWGG